MDVAAGAGVNRPVGGSLARGCRARLTISLSLSLLLPLLAQFRMSLLSL